MIYNTVAFHFSAQFIAITHLYRVSIRKSLSPLMTLVQKGRILPRNQRLALHRSLCSEVCHHQDDHLMAFVCALRDSKSPTSIPHFRQGTRVSSVFQQCNTFGRERAVPRAYDLPLRTSWWKGQFSGASFSTSSRVKPVC